MCLHTYAYMFIHTSVFVYVWIYGSTYMYMYSGVCINTFVTIYVCNDTSTRVQIHTYKQNVFMLWHITTFWGRAKRLGCPCSTVRKSLHRVPMVRTSLESAWPCLWVLCFGKTRLWTPPNSWWVCRHCWIWCAALHLTLDTEPIEYVYIYIFIHMYIYIYIFIYIHTRTHTHTPSHTRTHSDSVPDRSYVCNTYVCNSFIFKTRVVKERVWLCTFCNPAGYRSPY